MSSLKSVVRVVSMSGLVWLPMACSSRSVPPTPVAAPAPAAVAPTAVAATVVEQASTVLADASSQGARVQGIDVSHYQPEVDWEAVKSSVSFVFVKATDSTGSTDPRFTSHWSGARRAGLPRGAYHFFHPKYDVDLQVANFTRHLKDDPGELPPVLDVEEFKDEYQAFTCEQLAGMLQRFSQGVEKAVARRPMIYTNHQTWRMSFCDHAYFNDHPLWLAQYTNRPAQQPKLPPGWKNWLFWQYSETGNVGGIPGAVDQSFFNGSAQELRALLNMTPSGAGALSDAQP